MFRKFTVGTRCPCPCVEEKPLKPQLIKYLPTHRIKGKMGYGRDIKKKNTLFQ